jgi:hypothetical protein
MHPGGMDEWSDWLVPYAFASAAGVTFGVLMIQPILSPGGDRWVAVTAVLVLAWFGEHACEALAGWSRRRTSAGSAGP